MNSLDNLLWQLWYQVENLDIDVASGTDFSNQLEQLSTVLMTDFLPIFSCYKPSNELCLYY